MANIRVPVLHSVTDYLGFGGCIHHIMASVVVDSRAYDVAIAAARIPRLACIGLAMYEDTIVGRTKWGGVEVKRAVGVFPG